MNPNVCELDSKQVSDAQKSMQVGFLDNVEEVLVSEAEDTGKEVLVPDDSAAMEEIHTSTLETLSGIIK